METEHCGVSEERDLVDLSLNLFLGLSLVWDNVIEVSSGEEVLLVGVEDEITHELHKVGVEHTSVVVVSDTATIHGFTNQVAESSPR